MPKNISQYSIQNTRYGGGFSRIFCFFVALVSMSNRIVAFLVFCLISLLALCGCQNTQESKNAQKQTHNEKYQSSTQSKVDFRDSSDFVRDFDKRDFDKTLSNTQDFARLDSSHKDKAGLFNDLLDDLSFEYLLGGVSHSSGSQIFSLDSTIPAKDSTSTHKTILFFFGSPFCTPCKHIIQNIAESKTLQEVLKSHYQAYFIDILSKESLQINLPHLIEKSRSKITQKLTPKIAPQHLQSAEFHTTKKSLAHTLNIHATPTLLFLDNSGAEIFRFVGGLSKEHLLIVLDFLKSPPTSNNQQQIALELHKRFLAQNTSK